MLSVPVPPAVPPTFVEENILQPIPPPHVGSVCKHALKPPRAGSLHRRGRSPCQGSQPGTGCTHAQRCLAAPPPCPILVRFQATRATTAAAEPSLLLPWQLHHTERQRSNSGFILRNALDLGVSPRQGGAARSGAGHLLPQALPLYFQLFRGKRVGSQVAHPRAMPLPMGLLNRWLNCWVSWSWGRLGEAGGTNPQAQPGGLKELASLLPPALLSSATKGS